MHVPDLTSGKLCIWDVVWARRSRPIIRSNIVGVACYSSMNEISQVGSSTVHMFLFGCKSHMLPTILTLVATNFVSGPCASGEALGLSWGPFIVISHTPCETQGWPVQSGPPRVSVTPA